MITSLTLTGFKCFERPEHFHFNKLNLLARINGRGKSTVFQSLLMLAQSQLKYDDITKLSHKGVFVHTSPFKTLLNIFSKKEDNEDSDKVLRYEIETGIPDFRIPWSDIAAYILQYR